MDHSSIVGTVLMIFTGLASYKGFRDNAFFEHYIFDVDRILVYKEYRRLFSSGFLHSGWLHFGFNMMALLSFSFSLEMLFGIPKLVLLYFGSMLGGSLLALYIHRNHGDYRAVGASGAISGVIFSSIILFPNNGISLILIPIEFKSWILGVIFILVSIIGIKNKIGNIGHEAHLGGAITGVLITFFLEPVKTADNWWIVLLLLVPTIAFLNLIVRNPAVLMVDNYWGESLKNWKDKLTNESIEDEIHPQDEMDELLEKIKKSGFKSLTNKERERLNELRDKIK